MQQWHVLHQILAPDHHGLSSDMSSGHTCTPARQPLSASAPGHLDGCAAVCVRWAVSLILWLAFLQVAWWARRLLRASGISKHWSQARKVSRGEPGSLHPAPWRRQCRWIRPRCQKQRRRPLAPCAAALVTDTACMAQDAHVQGSRFPLACRLPQLPVAVIVAQPAHTYIQTFVACA